MGQERVGHKRGWAGQDKESENCLLKRLIRSGREAKMKRKHGGGCRLGASCRCGRSTETAQLQHEDECCGAGSPGRTVPGAAPVPPAPYPTCELEGTVEAQGGCEGVIPVALQLHQT